MSPVRSAEATGGLKRVVMGTTPTHHGPAIASGSPVGSPVRTLADASANGNSGTKVLRRSDRDGGWLVPQLAVTWSVMNLSASSLRPSSWMRRALLPDLISQQ